MASETKRATQAKPPQKGAKTTQDSQMDSGFMSGSNLFSTSSLCCDEMESGCIDSPTSTKSQSNISSRITSSQNLDSGIDLSERISSLNLSPISNEEASNTITVTGSSSTGGTSKLAQLGLSSSHIAILKEIFKKDSDGDTQLHVAVIRGFIEVVWHITRLLPHQALLDIPNKSGRTPLHLAVANGDACLARHLIVCGASPVAKSRRGETPLHIACRGGDPTMISGLTSQVTVFEVVTARLSYPPNHTPGLLAADLTNYDGQTCIHISAQSGHKEILQHLTWYGADVNAKEGKCGRTALHIAVESRDKDLVKFLVESCRAALNIQNYAGLTPYQLAFVNDAPEILCLLEDLGSKKEPVPAAFSSEDELDLDEEPDYDAREEFSWSDSDLRIGGIPQGHYMPIANQIPVSSHSPLNADQFF